MLIGLTILALALIGFFSILFKDKQLLKSRVFPYLDIKNGLLIQYSGKEKDIDLSDCL